MKCTAVICDHEATRMLHVIVMVHGGKYDYEYPYCDYDFDFFKQAFENKTNCIVVED